MQSVTPQSASFAIAQAPPTQAEHERKRAMEDAWKAYRGEFQKPLKVKEDQGDDNVVSNRCAPIVDKGVSFLFGQVLKIESADEATDAQYSAGDQPPEMMMGDGAEPTDDQMDGGTPEEEAQETPQQDFIEGLWGDDDDRMTMLCNMGTNGAVCGMNFVKIVPVEGNMRYPRVVVLDPQLIRIVTAPEDCSLVLAYIIEYPSGNDTHRRQVISRVDPDGLAGIAGEYDLDDTWTIADYTRRGQSGMWLQVGTPKVWPYPFAPIFANQNLPNPNEQWGKPDLTQDIIDTNKSINFVQSNTSRIIKYHASPMKYATGVVASEIRVGIDEVVLFPSPDSKMNILEMQSDLSSSLNFAAMLRSDMDEQSRVPAVALGRLESLPRGAISGVALQLLFQPLIEKTVQKQRLYGKLIREVTRACMVLVGLLGIDQYDDCGIELHWQNLLPVDDLAAAQTAVILQTLGVSKTTILQQLGYKPDDEAKKSALEDSKKRQMPTMIVTPKAMTMENQQYQQQQQESPYIGQ